MNKYLEKIAAVGPFFSRVGNFAEKVVGSKARQLGAESAALNKHLAAGRTARQVQDMAAEAAKETRDARIKAGVGAGLVVGGGFLGAHRYHQHKDRAIMKRLESTYPEKPSR